MQHQKQNPDWALETKCIHAGQSPEPVTGAVMPPIVTSSTYVQPSPGQHTGFEYSRSQNPTRYAWERMIARLESSTLTEQQDITFGGFAFASGLAAIATALELLSAGDEIIVMDDLYGGTNRLLNQVRARSQNLNVKTVDCADLDNLRAAITPQTRMVWLESPTNPMLKIADLQAIAEICRTNNIISVCDNTFATPILQRPIEFGIDIVMHSATKYLGGHSDLVAGVLVTAQPELAERLRFLQNAVGAVTGPFDAYLALRGAKTLALRMRQHVTSAHHLAQWIEQQPGVEKVIYPGLPSHPQHQLAAQQMQLDGEPACGGMITFIIEGGLPASRAFLENVSVFSLAESLGGVESLIEHPAIMTHASVPPELRAELGISDGLIRISVGIEHPEDLKADLAHAFTHAAKHALTTSNS